MNGRTTKGVTEFRSLDSHSSYRRQGPGRPVHGVCPGNLRCRGSRRTLNNARAHPPHSRRVNGGSRLPRQHCTPCSPQWRGGRAHTPDQNGQRFSRVPGRACQAPALASDVGCCSQLPNGIPLQELTIRAPCPSPTVPGAAPLSSHIGSAVIPVPTSFTLDR